METVINNLRFLLENKLFVSILNFFEVIVLVFTAIAGFKAAKQASYANELNLLPLLAIYFRKNKSKSTSLYAVRIKNIGNGAAYNIQASSITILIDKIKSYWKIDFKLQDTNVVLPGHERTLIAKTFNKDKPINLEDIMTAYLKSGVRKKPIFIPITFKNIIGNNYYCIAQLNQDEILIKSPSKRIRLPDKIYLYWLDFSYFICIKWTKFKWKFT